MLNRLPLRFATILLLLACPVFSQSSSGTLTIVYSPTAAIPTLGTAMLVLLAVLLSAVALRALKRIPAGRLTAVILALAGIDAVCYLHGVRFFAHAHAVATPSTLSLSNPNGGTATGPVSDIFTGAVVTNTSGQSQTINSIQLLNFLGSPQSITPGAGKCTVGGVLAPGQSCAVSTPGAD